MRSPVKALLLIAVMLWQTLVWVTPAGVDWQTERLAHLSDHAQDTDHHHHADASLHLSTDNDSSDHVHPDDGFQPVALGHTSIAAFVSFPGGTPAARVCDPVSACIGRLLRPPSSQA